MEDNFRITYQWERRLEPFPFTEDDFVDVTRLFLAMRYFLALFEGTFVLHIGNLRLDFDLSPDLSTIFEEIPRVLEELSFETQSPVELYFFEQGTDLLLLLERSGSFIDFHIEKKSETGVRFENIPDKEFSVSAIHFLREWIEFLQMILNNLVELEPELVNDESYQEYQESLLKTRRRI